MHLLVKRVVSGVGFVGISLLSVAAFAQESVAARETTVTGGTLMLVAYIALWLMIFGYLAMIMRRQSALSRDLTALERRMDDIFGEPNE